MTLLLTALAALGVIGVGAYTAGEAVRGWLGGGDVGTGPGSGRGGEISLKGRTGTHRRGGAGTAGGTPGTATRGGSKGWWTPERQKHAYDVLRAGGVSDMGAKGLVSRWKNVESTAAGPGSVNSIGAFGIAQWLGPRKHGISGNTNFDAQLAYVLKELNSNEAAAGELLRSAQTPDEGARAATAYERAENYQKAGHGQHEDDWTDKTLKGIPGINTAAPVSNPFAHWDPNFGNIHLDKTRHII
jgi:Phage tail lysozyme